MLGAGCRGTPVTRPPSNTAIEGRMTGCPARCPFHSHTNWHTHSPSLAPRIGDSTRPLPGRPSPYHPSTPTIPIVEEARRGEARRRYSCKRKCGGELSTPEASVIAGAVLEVLCWKVVLDELYMYIISYHAYHAYLILQSVRGTTCSCNSTLLCSILPLTLCNPRSSRHSSRCSPL